MSTCAPSAAVELPIRTKGPVRSKFQFRGRNQGKRRPIRFVVQQSRRFKDWVKCVQYHKQSRLHPSPWDGTPYGPRTSEAILAQSHTLLGLYHGPWADNVLCYPFLVSDQSDALEEVTKALEYWTSGHSHFSSSRAEALDRLRGIRPDDHWGPDIIYKAFKDLDLIFFLGVLTGCTRLRWETANHWLMRPVGGLITMACTSHESREIWNPETGMMERFPVEWIRLNSNEHFLNLSRISGIEDSWYEMWGSLLHEMVHAYLHATTMPRSDTHWQSHRVHFHRCLNAVNGMCRSSGLEFIGLFEPQQELTRY